MTKSDLVTFAEEILNGKLHFLRSAGGGKTNIKLDNLVKTFQMHCRSKPCGKYKNMTCRLKFGPFFTEKKP